MYFERVHGVADRRGIHPVRFRARGPERPDGPCAYSAARHRCVGPRPGRRQAGGSVTPSLQASTCGSKLQASGFSSTPSFAPSSCVARAEHRVVHQRELFARAARKPDRPAPGGTRSGRKPASRCGGRRAGDDAVEVVGIRCAAVSAWRPPVEQPLKYDSFGASRRSRSTIASPRRWSRGWPDARSRSARPRWRRCWPTAPCVRCRCCGRIAGGERRRHRGIADGAGERAVADDLQLAVPAGRRQPDLRLDVGRGGLQRHRHTAERPSFANGFGRPGRPPARPVGAVNAPAATVCASVTTPCVRTAT